MLILNADEMWQAVSLPKVMDTVEEAYRIFAKGEFFMPDRPVVTHGDDTLLYMPCFTEKCFGTKVLTLFPANPAKGFPYIDGLMLLNDAESGKTVSIMDGGCLTAMRTGAVGGVGMRCFSPASAHTVGVIGAGKQGFYQALYATCARDIRHIYLYDSFPGKDFGPYVASLQAALGGKQPEIHVCGSPEELLANSEIVVTASPATSPVMPNDTALLKGKCFVAIGSYKPTMRELPNAIWELVDHVYTELPFAMEESGDLSQPLEDGIITEDRVRYIGDYLLAHPVPVPPPPGTTTYFKSVGMGLLDLCVADFIYHEALRTGMGQKVRF
ncbi:ornithine cyclodeaminase family protein [Candidatus Formimonas warabiya]|uniref:Ornithine cyclodeaminase family protein n=1 Tax=Formimonas warabiya TaxID=1761012 RepID=A0A3G1KTJ3_FORW1|nr:ornithine cyclodeaminase family protein [Candidatus Formimonas warabiya]ATW25475.1 hypothetical protein DCMF_12430 [Candidatus Formimonas warabiya]